MFDANYKSSNMRWTRTEEKYFENDNLILNFFHFTDILDVNAHVDGSRWNDSLKNKQTKKEWSNQNRMKTRVQKKKSKELIHEELKKSKCLDKTNFGVKWNLATLKT